MQSKDKVLPARPEESLKETAGPRRRENSPGTKVSSFKCHGQKKKGEAGWRPWTCLSGVVVNPCASHFITVSGTPDGEREEEEVMTGANKEGPTLSHWN